MITKYSFRKESRPEFSLFFLLRFVIAKLTREIIGCAYMVSNSLGVGFLEKVYENALAIELKKKSIPFIQQTPIKVYYGDAIIGNFNVDLLVNDSVLVELKTIKSLDENHFAQCINYLKASNLKICLLINFGTNRIQVKRIIN